MDSRSLIVLTQRIGERRYGIVPRQHLLRNDVPAWWIDKRVAEKTLVAVYPGIYRLRGVTRRPLRPRAYRWNRLRAMGKRLVLITWRDAQDRPDKLVADIRRELAKPTSLFGHHYSP